jgi:hypothetical protein
MWRIVRSVAAIIAGLCALVGLYGLIGLLIFDCTHLASVPYGQYTFTSLSAGISRLLIAVGLAAFLAALLAPGAKLWHSLLIGIFMLASALMSGIPTEREQPVWYSILSLILIIPSSVIGGILATRLPIRWSHRMKGA